MVEEEFEKIAAVVGGAKPYRASGLAMSRITWVHLQPHPHRSASIIARRCNAARGVRSVRKLVILRQPALLTLFDKMTYPRTKHP